jgi:Na+/H+ antiporter NhaA
MRPLHRVLLLGACAAAVLVPAAAMAQESAPPAPTLSRSLPPWVGYIVMVLLLAAVVGVSLMPSKRGHQD